MSPDILYPVPKIKSRIFFLLINGTTGVLSGFLLKLPKKPSGYNLKTSLNVVANNLFEYSFSH